MNVSTTITAVVRQGATFHTTSDGKERAVIGCVRIARDSITKGVSSLLAGVPLGRFTL
jgi:hypothetical protein